MGNYRLELNQIINNLTLLTLLYRCRVDYLHGQTTFDSHNLEVVVMPGRPRIMMGREEGRSDSGWLEVVENSSLSLSCVSEGGRPRPNLTWWLDDKRLEAGYQR